MAYIVHYFFPFKGPLSPSSLNFCTLIYLDSILHPYTTKEITKTLTKHISICFDYQLDLCILVSIYSMICCNTCDNKHFLIFDNRSDIQFVVNIQQLMGD